MTERAIELVTTKPEAEIAADLKRRLEEAMAPVLALMDEGMAKGLMIQFDGVIAQPPLFRHKIINLRIAKHY
jgi:hypothetical protein